MLPGVNTLVVHTPPQSSLVATPLPGNNALRVPFDNVPPPVSSVQINNNARGNSTAVPSSEEVALSIPVSGEFSVLAAKGFPASTVTSPQIAFLAQLLGQPPSVESQGMVQTMMVEYDKLVALSQVKYKPSNATLPTPEPVSLFGRILKQEPVRAPVVSETLQAAQSAPQATVSASLSAPAPRPAPTPARQAAQVKSNAGENVSFTPRTVVPVAIRAYAQTASRNEALVKETVTESI